MRESRTYGSYGEGLETDGGSHSTPRQSLTRQLFFRNWKGAVRLDEIGRLQNDASLTAVVTASLLAAVLAQGISKALDQLVTERSAHDAASAAASP